MIGGLAAILMMFVGITGFLNIWWKHAEKQKVNEWIFTSSKKVLATPSDTVKIPLSFVHYLLQTILGERTFSKLSIRRSVTLSFIILFGSMGMAGLLTETTFGLKSSPWEAYETELKKFKETFIRSSNENHDLNKTSNLEAINTSLDTALKPQYKWIYSVTLLIIVIFVNLAGDIISLGVSRRILKDLQGTDSPTLITGALLLSLVTAILITFIVILVCNMVSNTLFISTTFLMLLLSGIWPFLTFSALVTNFGVALFSSSTWILAVAISAALPSIILILLALIALVLFPFRLWLNTTLKSMLERALSHEKGLLFFMAGIGASITAILGALIEIVR